MVFITLANKGGIGKTTISAYIAEYLLDNGSNLLCIDADPENHTLALYKSLDVKTLEIKNQKTNDIDKSAFDNLIEIILNHNGDIVIDNGASAFNALSNYLLENDVIGLLKEENIQHCIVSIIAGAGNTVDSLQGFKALVDSFDTDFLLFINELLGTTTYQNKRIVDTAIYANAKPKLIGEVFIEPESEYILKDILEMTKMRLLFKDLNTSEHFKIMQKRRLYVYREKIWSQLNTIFREE